MSGASCSLRVSDFWLGMAGLEKSNLTCPAWQIPFGGGCGRPLRPISLMSSAATPKQWSMELSTEKEVMHKSNGLEVQARYVQKKDFSEITKMRQFEQRTVSTLAASAGGLWCIPETHLRTLFHQSAGALPGAGEEVLPPLHQRAIPAASRQDGLLFQSSSACRCHKFERSDRQKLMSQDEAS